MLHEIARFELRYQLKNPVFWVSFVLFFLLSFASVALDDVHIGDSANVHRNATWVLAQKHFVLTIFYMFAATAFVANVVVRDDETGFGPIVHSTGVSKFAYLYGRFLGALVAAALGYAAIPLALALGAAMPWLDPQTLEPFHFVDYLHAYAVLGLPTVVILAAAFFAVATFTRSMMATYVAAVAFLALWIVALTMTSKPELRHLTAMLDPFGMGAFGVETKYWTPIERNHEHARIAGYLLYNRLLWGGVGAALLALAYPLYQTEVPAKKTKRNAKAEAREAAAKASVTAKASASVDQPPRFDARTRRAQLWLRTRFEAVQVLKSPGFFVLLALGMINGGGGLWFADSMYGGEIYPVTRVLVTALRGSFTFMPFLVAVYYSGELVWRERDRKTGDMIDATPISDVGLALPKYVGAFLVMIAMIAASALAAMLVQLLKGYTHVELGKYLAWYVLPESIDACLPVVLALFVQTLVPNKMAGWAAMVGWLVVTLLLTRAGFENKLYLYGDGPSVPLSDMNGQGTFGMHRDWYRLYWSAFATVLIVLSCLLWRRGTTSRLRDRLRVAPRRLRGGLLVTFVLAALVTVGMGIFLSVNVKVWNPYRTTLGNEEWAANDEKTLLGYENVPQPRITQVTVDVDIQPDAPSVTTHGHFELINRTDAPIDQLHVRWSRDLQMIELSTPGGTVQKEYPDFQYRIFHLDPPLAPGASTTLTFATVLAQRGTRNSDDLKQVVENGTFVNSFAIAPNIGMNRADVLKDRAKRRKYGLTPAEVRLPQLEDDSARAFNYLRRDSDWVLGDITVHTVEGQIPIAPGTKVSDSTELGRRTARFVTDAPILNFFSVQSARYQVREDDYGEGDQRVKLAVYYDPQHPYNVERMVAAMKASLEYYDAHFSPFQFHQCRILEFPDYAEFAQSFANTIPYSEGIGFIADYRDPEKIDIVTYVTAHEVGHQWWAHQVIGAQMQGETMLSETMAQYSALMVMEKMYGPDAIRKFLRYELDSYLRGRGQDVVEELPLVRVEDQGYIHYRKGSLVMYRLKSVVGEEVINRAARRLIAQYAFKPAPYPSSRDLVALLRAEAGPEHDPLITDLFEKITLYDIRTTHAEAHPRADGKFDVALTVTAQKMYADGQGRETPAPLDEDVPVGVFSAEPGKKDFSAKDVLAFEPRRLHDGEQTITFVVDRAPTFAGADPYTFLIDRNSSDNVVPVEH